MSIVYYSHQKSIVINFVGNVFEPQIFHSHRYYENFASAYIFLIIRILSTSNAIFHQVVSSLLPDYADD